MSNGQIIGQTQIEWKELLHINETKQINSSNINSWLQTTPTPVENLLYLPEAIKISGFIKLSNTTNININSTGMQCQLSGPTTNTFTICSIRNITNAPSIPTQYFSIVSTTMNQYLYGTANEKQFNYTYIGLSGTQTSPVASTVFYYDAFKESSPNIFLSFYTGFDTPYPTSVELDFTVYGKGQLTF